MANSPRQSGSRSSGACLMTSGIGFLPHKSGDIQVHGIGFRRSHHIDLRRDSLISEMEYIGGPFAARGDFLNPHVSERLARADGGAHRALAGGWPGVAHVA